MEIRVANVNKTVLQQPGEAGYAPSRQGAGEKDGLLVAYRTGVLWDTESAHLAKSPQAARRGSGATAAFCTGRGRRDGPLEVSLQEPWLQDRTSH